MNYDFIKDDILAIVGTISSIPNINALDAQLTALNQQLAAETDSEKKTALEGVISDITQVKSIKDQLAVLSKDPESFVNEFDKVFCPDDDTKGFAKKIVTFDSAILAYNKADHFEKSTIPGSTISNVTQILEQMNRVSLMYVCIHDKVAAAKHKDEVAHLREKAEKTNREIGKAFEKYENTDLTQLKQNMLYTQENLLKAKADLEKYSDPKEKEKFIKGRDEALKNKNYSEQIVRNIETEISTLNTFVATLDGSTLASEAKALDDKIKNGLDTNDQDVTTNKVMANATLISELDALRKEYNKKEQELKALKEMAGPTSSPQLDRLERLFENAIRRHTFAEIIRQISDLIPDETKTMLKDKLTVNYVINHLADDKRIPEQNLILISLLVTRLSACVPDEVKAMPGGYFAFVLRPDAEAHLASLASDSVSEEARKDRELLGFIEQLGSIESTLATVRATEGMTEEEYKRIEKTYDILLNQLKKSPLYSHGMYEYMNLYQEKIQLASKMNEKAYLADVQSAYSTITTEQKKKLKKELIEKKREIYNHCKTSIEQLPENLQPQLFDSLGLFNESASIEELETLYDNVKNTVKEMINSKKTMKSQFEKAAQQYENEMYLHSEKLWNINLERQKTKVDDLEKTNEQYTAENKAIKHIMFDSTLKCRSLRNDLKRLSDANKSNICAGVNYFDSLAAHARRLRDASVYTKKDGHKDSSEYEGMVDGLKRLALMYSRVRNNTELQRKEPTFGKYKDEISMTSGAREELLNIKAKAGAYIDAKKAQRFHWIPSTMRKYRLSYAKNVLDFCESQLVMLEHVTFEDLDLPEDRKAFDAREKIIQKSAPLTSTLFEDDIWNNRKVYIDYARSQAGVNMLQQPSGQPMMQNSFMNEQEEISTSLTTMKKDKILMDGVD